MLDSQSKKILESFRALDVQEGDFCDAFFDSEEISEHSGVAEKDVERCFLYLYDQGYILPRSDECGNVCEYSLTQQGRHFEEFQKIERLEFLKKSIFCPIVVSMLTTLITLWIKSLF